MSTPADTVLVRPVEPADEQAVLALLTDSLGQGPTGPITADFYRWKHLSSPFGTSPGLLAEHDGRVVGVRLFLRWELSTGGRTLRAVRAVDTATDPAYQGRGIFRRLTMDLLESLDRDDDVDLVFNTPNGNSRPGYLKMGWHEVGTLPVRLHPVRPLRLLRHARSAAADTAAATHGALPGPSGSATTLGLAPFEPVADVLRDRAEAVEQLLRDSTPPPGLHTPLTTDYLRWRYADAPLLDYRCLTVEVAGRLAGLAIGRMRRRGDLVELTVGEVITAGGSRSVTRKVLRRLRRSGADHITLCVPSGSTTERDALGSGYLVVPGRGIGLVVNPRRPLPVDVDDPGCWGLSLGDLEVF